MNYLKKSIRWLISLAGFSVVKVGIWDEILEQNRLAEPFLRWNHKDVPQDLTNFVLTNLEKSYSQIQQDLFVAFFSEKFEGEHFFVEFGATDGIRFSNTYLLEKQLGWNGILSEPAEIWHEDLQRNRNCEIDFRCVYSSDNQILEFSQVNSAELSTLIDFKHNDSHSKARDNSNNYLVKTVSLNSLLKEHNAPGKITYLSVDTEGSEWEILREFPFDDWTIDIVTVEHNYTENRLLLDELILPAGYVKVFPTVSKFDSWYLSKKLATKFGL
jgi:FkbM family methyltransferase